MYNANGGKNRKRHGEWEKKCIAQMERIGLPKQPILRAHTIKIEIRHHTYRLKCSNMATAQCIRELMEKAGILVGDSIREVKNTIIESKMRPENPGFTIWMYVDENDKKNKGASFEGLPVIGGKM